MIESASLDNVLGHLMFHKALIDEGRGAEKIDRYLGLLRSAEEEKQIAGREPLDRSLQLVFELVLSNDLDPWDVDLMKFAKLYGQRMHTEEVDFIVAGKLMHMAWSILHLQSREVLSLNERREELYFGEWDTESFDQFVEHPLPAIDLDVPDCVELTEVVRHRCTRPVSLVDLLDAFDTAQQEVEIALNRQRVREQLLKAQERFDGKAHSDDQEKDVAETWARIERCGSGPIALEDLFEDDKEDSIKVFVSLLFLARAGKISLWQDELPYGQIYLEIKLPWEIAQLVDGTQAEALAIQAKMVM
ncbi:MAG TPA: segregation/condensation protein A [Methanomassiliicoccales archaeon]|jgi:segregation and condensation protein A|nr:segregation/condensation protein A [Methanomassiliicoccales archaeon]